MKITRHQSGHAHLLLFAALVVTAVAAVGVYVKSGQPGTKTALLTSSNAQATVGTAPRLLPPKKQVQRDKPTPKITKGAYIQFVVSEQVVGTNGKTKLIGRGHVPVTITTTDAKARCRDAGHFYLRAGNTVFAGKTDGKLDHTTNVGKIKADRCTSGTYTLSIAPDPARYKVVGDSSKTVTLGTTRIIQKFTIVDKNAPAPVAKAAKQDTTPTPNPAPADTPPSPLTPAQEKAAIDKTGNFEQNMFFAFLKSCVADDDLGDTPANRKTKFARDSASYMTPSLIATVNSQYGGDAFPLLKVSDLHCGQYERIKTDESVPIVTSGAGTTAVVEHTFTATARAVPFGNYQKAADVTRTWVYSLVRDGAVWKIAGIQVK